jgi:16S rRNA (cytosine967-C5)-methyltransferase
LETGSLGGRDAAFAHAIYDAALHRWLTIEHLLNCKLRQPLASMKPGARAVLMAGVAQMLFLSRVPVHAAINEAVEWAKRHLGGSMAGMVNGVLRGVSRAILTRTPEDAGPEFVRRSSWGGERHEVPLPDGSSILLREPLLPEDPWSRLAVAVSLPVDLLARWRAALGDDEAQRQARHLLVHPPTVLHLTETGEPPQEIARHSEPHAEPGHRVWTGTRPQLVAALAAHPGAWVQDAASSRAVRSIAGLASRVGEGLIIDLCAGQGTKTRQLAAAFPRAAVIATDVDEVRLARLREATSHLDHVRVVAHPEAAGMTARAAAVLVDAPCTNSGVLARRVEARYRWSPAQLERLTGVQRDILSLAARLAAPGGFVLYSTCSIEREENQAHAAWAKEAGLREVQCEQTLPRGVPGEPPAVYHDGSYWALLERE